MKKHFPYVMFIILISILFILLVPKNLFKHDSVFHYHQSEDLRIRLDENFFNPSPISKYVGNGYGYGSSLFYPPLMHSLTAVTSQLLSIDTFQSIDLISGLFFILSGIAMYFLAYKLFHHQNVALLAALLYLFFPYHISDIWSRGAYAECLIFFFFPLIISGLIDLIRGNYVKFYVLFVGGYVGGIYSHYLSMFFLSFLLIPFFIVYRREIFTKEKLKALLLACLFIILFIIPLIVPILEHRLALDYRVFDLNIMASKKGVESSILNIRDYFFMVQTGYNHGLPVYVDYVSWLLFILCILSFKKLKKIGGKHWLWLLYTIILTMFCLSFKPLWLNTPSFFRILQFVWRLEIMLAISMSLFVSYYLVLYKKKVSNLMVMALTVMLFVTGHAISIGQNVDITHDEIIEEVQDGVGWQAEYLPKKATFAYLWEREKGILANEEIAIENVQDNTPYLQFTVETKEPVEVELPRIYYLGYVLKDEENHSIPLTVSDHGFLEANIPKSGTYTLTYVGTFGMHVSRIIGIVSFVIFIVFLGWKSKIFKK